MLLLFVNAGSWWLVEERRSRERCEGVFIVCLGSVATCLWFYYCVQVMDIIDVRLLLSLSVEVEEQYGRLKGGLVVTRDIRPAVGRIRQASKIEILL